MTMFSWRLWRALAVLTLGAATLAAAPGRAAEGEMIAPTLGEDGLYHHDFFLQSFLDLPEDLADSHADGKRLVVVFEQRGCIYCKQVNTELLGDPAIHAYVKENYNVVQLNLFGDRSVTDLDGEVMTEKALARRWGILFTPTFVFMPEDPADAAGLTGKDAAVFTMQGAFGKHTFTAAFEWVKQKGYEGDAHFQSYVAETLAAREAAAQ
ncbi:SoxW family protein [Roseospira visakhapatnamensis]|uniref:Thioredoxin-related protein n=1 Tax=Roseospira visakhapatnamensis TaxID=390880 RepID=A0A7W6RC52_9PROT|nr:thioredoxin family protein [Roseospira visakhapatnamensis]MBB4265703.1 thioredoxin-related protein [Roseospira visakhapatnamensis]